MSEDVINGFLSIKDKTILVTGASSGIGKAIAILLSKMGCNVIMCARNEANLALVHDQLDPYGNHEVFKVDFNQQKDLENLVDSIPKINGFVNSAGMLKKQPLKFLTTRSINETLDVNFVAPAFLSKLLYKKKKLLEGASVVFISSIASTQASLGNATYMASKGAISSFAKGMALELAPKKIRVNCISPALIRTPLVDKALSEKDLDTYLKKFPLGRFGTPTDVANCVVYLISDASSWVTGINLILDGGVTLKN